MVMEQMEARAVLEEMAVPVVVGQLEAAKELMVYFLLVAEVAVAPMVAKEPTVK